MSEKPEFNPKRPFDRHRWAINMGIKYKLKPSARSVLVYLAYRWNFKKARAWPSQETISKDTGIASRTVRRATTILAEHGIISIYHPLGRRNDGGGRFANEYWLNFTDAKQAQARQNQAARDNKEPENHADILKTMRTPCPDHADAMSYQQDTEQVTNEHSAINISAPTEKTAVGAAENEARKKEVYLLGKEAIGKNSGGLITKLIDTCGVNGAKSELEELLTDNAEYYGGGDIKDMQAEARNYIGNLIGYGS